MAVKTRCPHCGKAFSLQASYLGKRFKCSGCGKKFEVTAPETGEQQSGSPARLTDVPRGRPAQAKPLSRRKWARLFECVSCGGSLKYEQLRCPHCKAFQTHKIKALLASSRPSHSFFVPFLDLLFGPFCLALIVVAVVGLIGLKDIATLSAVLSVVFYLLCQVLLLVFRKQTVFQRMVGVVVVDSNCNRVGVIRQIARLIMFVVSLIPSLLLLAIMGGLLGFGIFIWYPLHERVCGTFQVKESALKAFLLSRKKREREYLLNGQQGCAQAER